jgi:hypothetical protein
MKIIDARAAVRNTRLYASAEGNKEDAALSFRNSSVFDCKYIPAITGPIDIPIKSKTRVIPTETPVNCTGVALKSIFHPALLINVAPIDIAARFAIIDNSDE